MPPGATGTIEVDVQSTTTSGTTNIAVYNEGNYVANTDLSQVASQFQPPGLSPAAWNAVYANFETRGHDYHFV